jgi:archaeosine-15-forming tRNA-guanine transglycosylase
VFEFGETRRLFDLGGEALAFKPRYNVQPAQYNARDSAGKKIMAQIQASADCLPRWMADATTQRTGSNDGVSLASKPQHRRVQRHTRNPCMRRRIEENRKVKVLMRFIIAAALGIQQSTEALLVNKMNELAVRLRESRTEIDNLRRQLSIMRKPVQLIDFSTSLRFPVYPLSRTSSVLAFSYQLSSFITL